ncbi:MAG TPA: gliding motility-associated C-terminal domain-containing protein, partial [Saprospiraceae bacterium]|nr:gliding motility-associated C-terminal domain-containing protein [Saprospiraceae bacterium]
FDIEDPSTVFLVLIVTDTNGCTASEAKSFQVQELDLIFNPEADSICNGESVHLLLNGDSTLTYTWAPPNGLNLNQPWDPIAFPGISVEYYVTVTDGVCTISDSTFVEVQQLPNLAFDYETDCKSLEVQFNNTSTNGVNYHWDFGDTSITTDTSILVNPTYTYNQSGVYIITLSSRDGCDVSITDTITANAILDQLPEATVNCFKDSIELNPGYNPLYNYVWSPAEFLDNPNLPNPTAGVENDTWFYVTITESSLPGCEIIDSILLQVPDDFEISTGDETITSCDFDEVTLTATVTGNQNIVITWTDLDGTILGNGPVLVVNPTNTTTYIATGTDTLGCSKADTVTVLKPDPTFEVNIIPNDTAYCYIQTITLFATSVNGVTFEWYNANNELIGTGPTIEVTPGVFSCYHLIGTDPLGCQASDTVCLSPTYFEVNISSAGEDFCLGENTTLTASTTSVNGVTYEWFNAQGESQGTGEALTVSPPVSTCYYLVGTDTLGCQDADTICINPIPFDASITGDNAVCPGDPTTLTVTSTIGGPLTYIWDPTGSTESFITVSPEVTTTYNVTVTSTEFGCDTVLNITVEVFQFNPTIEIDAEPDTIFLTDPTQLTVNQNPDFDYVWEAIPPGENIPPIYNPVVTPTESTTYCVTVTDDNGCTGTACIAVTVNDLFCDDRDIFIPNAFTPNTSGVNDVLFVRSNFIATMELVIYNRWGEKVFSTTDQSIGWDGTYKGQLLSPDVFGYYLTVMCPNEETYTKKGNITLLH